MPLAGRPTSALTVLALAAITDVLDGWIARRAGKPSRWGDWLDPVCDKLFMVGVVTGLYLFHHPSLHVLLLILTREIALLPLYLLYRAMPSMRVAHYEFRAHAIGKANTVAQFLGTTALVMHHSAALPLALACAVLGLASAVVYTRRAMVRRPGAR